MADESSHAESTMEGSPPEEGAVLENGTPEAGEGAAEEAAVADADAEQAAPAVVEEEPVPEVLQRGREPCCVAGLAQSAWWSPGS